MFYAGVVAAVVIVAAVAAGVAVALTNRGDDASPVTTSPSGSNPPGPVASLRIAMMSLEDAGAGGGRRSSEGPYGDAGTRGATVAPSNISSFKVAPLQVVLCAAPLAASEHKSRSQLMGVRGGGAASIQENMEKFNCSVVCGAEEDLGPAASWWDGQQVWDMAPSDVKAYADGLRWVDLKSEESRAQFEQSCSNSGLPAATWHWGWIVYAPVYRMTASVPLPNSTKALHTRATNFGARMSPTWGLSPAQAVLTDHNMETGPAEEATFYTYDAGQKGNFFTYQLSQPLATTAGGAYSLTMAVELDGMLNAYSGVVQPTAGGCYPDHPFEMKQREGSSTQYVTDATCCTCCEVWNAGGTACATPGAAGLADLVENGDSAKGCRCNDWNLYSLMDKHHNAIDVSYLQMIPLVLAPSEAVWRHEYAATSGSLVPATTNLERVVLPPHAPNCTLVVQLLFVTPGAGSPPAAGDLPVGSVLNWQDCFYRDRRSEMTQSALAPRSLNRNASGALSIYGGLAPWYPLATFPSLATGVGQEVSVRLGCSSYWDCWACSQTEEAMLEALSPQCDFNCLGFYDTCHDACFPDNCGVCSDDQAASLCDGSRDASMSAWCSTWGAGSAVPAVPRDRALLTNEELAAMIRGGRKSYQDIPRAQHECKGRMDGLVLTLREVTVLSGAAAAGGHAAAQNQTA